MRLFLLIIFCFGNSLFASERAGNISLTEALVWPTYFSQETNGGEFELDRSQFGVGWRLDQYLQTRFLIGSSSEIEAPAYYRETTASQSIALLEAYGEYEGLYGKVKMGLMPLPMSYENRTMDRDLIFQDSLIFEKRLLAKRDYGLALYTGHNGYFTEIMAHNGEVSQRDNDGNIWATTRWGWTDDESWHLEYAMQVGKTKPSSTAADGQNNAIAGFDSSQAATWKFSHISVHWFDRKWDVLAEGFYGDVEQKNLKNRLSSYHIDITHMFRSSLGLALRYDHIDLDEKIDSNGQTASSLALILGGQDGTSRFFITATKRDEESNETLNDELRISWRIRPYF